MTMSICIVTFRLSDVSRGRRLVLVDGYNIRGEKRVREGLGSKVGSTTSTPLYFLLFYVLVIPGLQTVRPIPESKRKIDVCVSRCRLVRLDRMQTNLEDMQVQAQAARGEQNRQRSDRRRRYLERIWKN